MNEQLKALYKSKISDARALMEAWKDKPMPEDVQTKVNGLLGEADALKVQIETAERVAAGEDFLAQPAGTKAAHHGWRESGPNEGEQTVDPLAWRQLEVKTIFGVLPIRYNVPLAVQAKGYSPAFESYIRKGLDFVGPNDRKTLSEGVDSAGGYLVPEDWQSELLRKTAINAVIRQLARVITTSRDSVSWPKLTYTTDNKWTSPVRLTWTGEIPVSATAHRVTDPTFGSLSIAIHTAMASLPLSNNLLEDSAFDVVGVGTDLLGEAFGLGEDDVFVNGTGVSQPFGLQTRITVGTETIGFVVTGAAATVTADGFIDLFFGLPAQYRRNARFIMNSVTAKAARKLKDGASRYIWDAMQAFNTGGLNSPAVQDSLLGAGVSYDEFMPDPAGNAYVAFFGDFTGYLIADRAGMSVQRLSELYAETNITLLLAKKRVGADVIAPYRILAHKCST